MAICCRICHEDFVIHRRCYRGHVYCSDECREQGRRLTAKAAHDAHRSSEEGRLDHRDAERERRAHRKRVGDQSSKKLTESVKLNVDETNTPSKAWSISPVPDAPERRGVYAVAAYRVTGNDGPPTRTQPTISDVIVLERLASRACIACGRRDGRLVRMVDGGDRSHNRGPPVCTF